MRVLVITQSYSPLVSGGAIAAENLCKGLSQKGHDVTVLVTDGLTAEIHETGDNHIRVIRSETEQEPVHAKSGQAKRFDLKTKVKSIFVVILDWISGGQISLICHERNRAASIVKNTGYFVRQQQIELVISICFPFHTHLVGQKLKKRFNLRWFPYYFDPFYNNQQYPVSSRWIMQTVELHLLRRADCILVPSYLLQDYQRDEFNDLRSLIKTIELPVNPDQPGHMQNHFSNTAQCINCVYIGSLYCDIRNPDPLFRLWEKLNDTDFYLTCIGRKSGFSDQYFADWQERLGHHLVMYNQMPRQFAQDELAKSDILIHIGNRHTNQLPSKVFDYIMTGKPIVNIYSAEGCPSRQLIDHYPLGLNIAADQADTTDTVQAFQAFCTANAGKCVSQQEVEAIMQPYSVHAIVTEIEKAYCEML